MNLDILFSGCPRWNIVKQNTISTFVFMEKKKEMFCLKITQVCLFVLRFNTQSTQWGYVKRGHFT